MLSSTHLRLSYVRGGFGIGSRHQKHQAYAPVPYLYRFPGKRGPGPVLMKYFHTLGTFPTGLEVPFRLGEFHQNYIREHVPQDLEDWLRCVVYDPAETINSNMSVFMERLTNAPLPKTKTVFGRSQLLDAKNIHAPLQKAFEEFGIEIPVIAVRAVASHPKLKEEMLDVCFAYHETVSQIGSTPHRRWAAMLGEQQQQEQQYQQLEQQQSQQNRLEGNERDILSLSLSSSSSSTNLTESQTKAVAQTLSSVLSFPQNEKTGESAAAPDEILAAKMLTTLAEGCHRGTQGKSTDAAVRLLESALKFAQEDERVSGITHANLASAYAANGNFEKSQLHAREAVLRERSNPRAHAAWAVTTALQDDFDTALQIAADALQEQPNSEVLMQVHEEIARAACGRITTPESGRARRYQLQSQVNSALRTGAGRCFDNGFDWATDVRGNRTQTKMDPTYAGLGTEVKRSPEGSGPLNHLNREER